MSAIDKVTAHFDTFETAKVEVPEWEMTIYVEPMTLQQQSALLKKSKKTDDVGAAVEAILMLAKDDQGNPLFTLEDKPVLMRKANPDVLGRVAAEILHAHDEDAEKN
jgi:hypothetical protein